MQLRISPKVPPKPNEITIHTIEPTIHTINDAVCESCLKFVPIKTAFKTTN